MKMTDGQVIMNLYVKLKEGLTYGRIVLVSGVSLMKEVFNLKITANRPEMVFSTTMSKMITDGRSSDAGELIKPHVSYCFFPICNLE